MKRCYVVLAEPDGRFLSVHHTITGAVHFAASEGATTMLNHCPITVSDVAAFMRAEPMISFGCGQDEEFEGIRIERHFIAV